jgi:protoheme ferro-lyase
MAASWIVIFIGAVTGGVALVGLLALKRSAEPLMALLSLVGIALSVWGILELTTADPRVRIVFVSIGFAGAAFAGGYGLGAALLPLVIRRKPSIRLSTSAHAARHGIGVLVVACAEPTSYEPLVVSQEFDVLNELGRAEMPLGITPFLYAAQKARYRAAGGTSPAASQAAALTERVETLLKTDGRFERVRLVTCSAEDTLDVAVVDMAASGIERMVIAAVSIGESYDIDHAKVLVDMLRPAQHGVRIVHTAPLWGSEILANTLANKIMAAAGSLETTGVALVMTGQPEHRRKTHGAFDVQENAFCSRVRLQLVERALLAPNVRTCSLEWRDPDITETVRHLAALGCDRILVSPACMPFETVTTRLDLLVAVQQARVDESVSVVTLQTWGQEPSAAEVIADAIREAADDLPRNPV